MPKHVVKQFGLQRTGTNYLRQLLMHNYNARVLTNGGGWKHGRYKVKRVLGHEVDCVVMTKNLLSWLWSYYKYTGQNGTFVQFVTCGTYIEHWNALNGHWLDVAERLTDSKMIFSRCEDLVANPKKECQRIAKALDRIRKLSDVEFELEKAELAKAVKAAIVPPQKDSRYKAAYFLLIPGASKVYANYIRRLDKKGKARASR